MSRIQLILYTVPGQLDVYCRLKLRNGNYERLTATIDTGAAVSLFPIELLDSVEHSPAETRSVTINQAGIQRQVFNAVEALVSIVLEDFEGNITQPFQIPAWFADTEEMLLGFAGVLDRSVLHVDMPQQTGWIEINS
jgi:hypothetical protein